MKQIPNLTPLRGIAALLIVLYHYSGFRYLPALSGLRASAFVDKSYLAVDLFFLLSGYVIAHVHARDFSETLDWRSFVEFLWARFARVYPIYLFILLIFVAVRDRVDVNLVHTLFLTQSPWTDSVGWNFPTWSISAEWHAYLAFPFIVVLLYRRDAWIAVASIAASFIALSCLNVAVGSLDVVKGAQVLLRVIPEFTIGMLVQRLQIVRSTSRFGGLFLPSSLLAVAISMAFRFPDAVIVAMEALVLISAVRDYDSVTARVLNTSPLVFLGDISYSVYVNQIGVFEAAKAGLGFALLPEGFARYGLRGQLFALVCFIGVLIAFSTLTYRCIEAPARRWLRSWRWYGGPGTDNAGRPSEPN